MTPEWEPLHVTTDDYHTGGEPFRIVTGGAPDLLGQTVAERRLWAADHVDHIRKLLVNEPRGHADMYGCFVTPPDDEDADLGVVFFHNEGYSTACGHGTIALATWAVDTGRVAPDGDNRVQMRIDAPSGRLDVTARLDEDGQVEGVSFRNVPSFVKGELVVDMPNGRTGGTTIAFGGAFYAIVKAVDAGLDITRQNLPQIIAWARDLKQTLNADHEWVHPLDPRLRDIYGVILVEEVDPRPLDVHMVLGDSVLGDPGEGFVVQRNVTVFADGEVDRSPTGSGTSARLAALHRYGQIAVGQGLVNLSIIDTVMSGMIEGTTTIAGHPAVHTRIGGTAFRTGTHEFTLDPRDDLGTGFQLR
ncbi:MAG: proline racemase family protein [Euzebya sp.]